MLINGQEISAFNTDVKQVQAVGTMLMSSPIINLMERVNSFLIQGMASTQGECRPFIACGKQIGLIRPDVTFALANYPDVFSITANAVYLNSQFDTYKSRSEAIDGVLRDLRVKNSFCTLKGWREECFNVWSDFGTNSLFEMERSAVTLFGVRAFGVHITGYTQLADGQVGIWLQKRSQNKPTWPGMFDSMVGGGITAGLKPSEVLVKEAAEEASIPDDLIVQATSAGAVSFLTETERGIHANTEFVYDLELPPTFVPTNYDGEAEGFELVLVNELLNRVLSPKYKLTSAPIAIDFLLRRGLINPDNESDLPALQELLHVPLNQLYKRWSSLTCNPNLPSYPMNLPPTPPHS